MKPLYKIFIGITAAFLIFIICDMTFFYCTYFKQINFNNSIKKYLPDNIKKNNIPKYFIKLTKFKDEYFYTHFRPIQNPNSNENPILIFGCSYAFGSFFDNSETISYVMSQYSARPIINRAYNEWGIQHMLFQLKNDNKFCSSIKPPKYVFFVLNEDFSLFGRMYFSNFPSIYSPTYYLTYKLKNGTLQENKPFFNLYFNFSFIRYFQNKHILKDVEEKFEQRDDELFNLFIIHCKEINDLIKTNWGNDTKFIILTFEDTKKEMWAHQLNEMGIDVIDIAETIGYTHLKTPDYKLFEPEVAPHPTGKLWKLLVPKLKEKYPDL